MKQCERTRDDVSSQHLYSGNFEVNFAIFQGQCRHFWFITQLCSLKYIIIAPNRFAISCSLILILFPRPSFIISLSVTPHLTAACICLLARKFFLRAIYIISFSRPFNRKSDISTFELAYRSQPKLSIILIYIHMIISAPLHAAELEIGTLAFHFIQTFCTFYSIHTSNLHRFFTRIRSIDSEISIITPPHRSPAIWKLWQPKIQTEIRCETHQKLPRASILIASRHHFKP